jgi:hypothetical protein
MGRNAFQRPHKDALKLLGDVMNVFKERDVVVPGLDEAHDGVRIAHLTDLHVGCLTPARKILRAIEMAQDSQARHSAAFDRRLRLLRARSSSGGSPS